MRLCTFVSAAFLSLSLGANAQTAPQAAHWPTQDGIYTIHNFHFKDGETLPELRLHYITLGTPHRDAAGHIDNAILLLHGSRVLGSSLWPG
jgi:homoserine O-acetyltransferase